MSLTKAEHDELCCVYAGLLLFDDKVDITADKLNKVIAASGNTVEAYYPEFFAKYLASADLNAILNSVGSGPAVAAGPVAETKAEEKKDDKKGGKAEKKKEEPKQEEEDVGFGIDLFG